jgi:hypothetical protein
MTSIASSFSPTDWSRTTAVAEKAASNNVTSNAKPANVDASSGPAASASESLNSSTSPVSALEAVTSSLRRVLSAVSDMGHWLDHVSSTAVGLHAVSKQRTSIEIQTKDGDVVRLRFASRSSMDIGAASVASNDKTVTTGSVSVSQQERFALSIDGDLDADELKAIGDVIVRVDALAKEFFNGDVDAAFAHAATLNIDSDELATVAVRLSQRQRIAVTAAHVSSPSQPQQPAVPATSSVPASVKTGDVTPALQAQPESEVIGPNEALPSAALVAPQTEAKPSVNDASATESIARYIAKLTTTLRASDNELRLGMSFRSKLTLLLTTIKDAQPDKANPDALQKLNDVAEKAHAAA